MAKTFLTAEWRKLIMANYLVPESLLHPYLPHGTELDTYAGRCYVSLVGFLFQETRLKGFRIPFHMQFEEVNLRFYVRRMNEEGGQRRGVVFIKELVPRFALSLVANALYGEHYATVPMRHEWRCTNDNLSITYSWRQRGRWYGLTAHARSEAQPIGPGREEEFLTEHYWGYTRLRDGRTSEYEVVHPRWQVYPIERYEIDVDFAQTYGSGFSGLNGREPYSVLLAEGSRVEVRSGRQLASA